MEGDGGREVRDAWMGRCAVRVGGMDDTVWREGVGLCA